jgi:hypothetical protein
MDIRAILKALMESPYTDLCDLKIECSGDIKTIKIGLQNENMPGRFEYLGELEILDFGHTYDIALNNTNPNDPGNVAMGQTAIAQISASLENLL